MSFLRSLKAFFSSLWLQVHASWIRLYDFCYAFSYFLRSPRFVISYLSLTFLCWKNNPYRMSLRFHRAKKKNPYQFGTTPLFTLNQLSKKAHVLSDDVVYELGCGTGHTLFWLGEVIGCKTHGIEWVDDFVSRIKTLKQVFKLEQVSISKENYLEADLSEATVIYLYGTCMEEEEIETFCGRLTQLKAGCRLVTVSFPLTAYCQDSRLQLLETFSLRFPWGKAEGYLQAWTSA